MATNTETTRDPRGLLLTATLKRHHYRPDALIEVLHKAQELFGYLSLDRLRWIARELKLPPSRVYGVATFYHLFSLKPRGEHTCTICMGTACYVKGAADLLAQLETIWGVKAGETRGDGKISLATARCVGACGLAPVGILDGSVTGHLSVEETQRRAEEWDIREPIGT